METQEAEERIAGAVEQLVDWKLELEKGVTGACATGIPWIAHEIELLSTAADNRFQLHLNFGVKGFWVCGHDVAVLRDDEGEE